MWKCSIEFKYNSWRSWSRGSKTNPNCQLVNKNLLDQSTPAILLQIVMVSPGTHPAKNHESQSRIIESQFKNMSPWVSGATQLI